MGRESQWCCRHITPTRHWKRPSASAPNWYVRILVDDHSVDSTVAAAMRLGLTSRFTTGTGAVAPIRRRSHLMYETRRH
jgi:hypothetical protein